MSNPSDDIKSITHFRRCHICDSVNATDNSFTHHCQGCGKYFAPFYFYNESDFKGIKDDGLVWTAWKASPGYHSLCGFSTYWEDEPDKISA